MAGTSRRLRGPVPQRRRGEGLSGGSLLLAALLAVAFGVGAVLGGYLWMSQPKHSEAIVSATTGADAPAAPTVVDKGAWTDADTRMCRDQATLASLEAKRRRIAAVSADRLGLGGPEPGMVERATYLLCGATRKPLHLCDDYWRGWFIEALKAYAIEFKQVSTQGYWAKVDIAERARRESGAGWQRLSNDLDQTTREVAKMHADIVTAFRKLIADGIVSPDSFGVFFGYGIHPDIGAMIGEAKPLRELCS